MAFTLTQMITLKDLPSTHAILRVRSTIMHKIAVLGVMTVQTLANRALIAWLRRKSVLMLTAMVGKAFSRSRFYGKLTLDKRSTIRPLLSSYRLGGDSRSFSVLRADPRIFSRYTRNNLISFLSQDMFQQRSFLTPRI